MNTPIQRLGGGGRFDVSVGGDPPVVTKRGDPAALRREARVLRLLAGRGVAPGVVRAGEGLLVTTYVPGKPRDLTRVTRTEATALGATLRQVHETARSSRARLAHWRSPARSLAAYRRRRVADMQAAAPPRWRALAEQVARSEEPPDPRSQFRLLHGDLAGANIIWTPDPTLVDWEFWRMGDPAEDLAYLFVVSDLPARVEGDVLAGYADPTASSRVDAWRHTCALDAGFWFLAHGQTDLGEALVRRVSGSR